METITLYHGTPDKIVTPTYGLGEDRHDYGRGFYLTESVDLPGNGQYADLMKLMDGFISMNWIVVNLKYWILKS